MSCPRFPSSNWDLILPDQTIRWYLGRASKLYRAQLLEPLSATRRRELQKIAPWQVKPGQNVQGSLILIHPSIHCIYLAMCYMALLCMYLSTHLYINLSSDVSIYRSIHYIDLSISISIFYRTFDYLITISIYNYIYLSISISIYLFIYLSIYLIYIYNPFSLLLNLPKIIKNYPRLFVLGKFRLVNLTFNWSPFENNLNIKVHLKVLPP